jgi:hypothetical protein
MAQFVRPVAKQVYICDDVVGDSTSGKVSLLNLWHTVRVPSGATFPYCLGKLCVFVWWRGGLGRVRSRVDVVQAGGGILVRRTGDCILDFADRSNSVYARYRLENVVFPKAGTYLVEVYCENEFVDDQIVRVITTGGS